MVTVKLQIFIVDYLDCFVVVTFFKKLLSQLMCELGNGVINQIYEARREELGARKPQPGDPRYSTGGKVIHVVNKQTAESSQLNLCVKVEL